MPKIKVDQATLGMVLADDVSSSTGRLLMKAGAELSEGFEQALLTWGILEINVVGEAAAAGVRNAEGDEALNEEELLKVREQLLPIFAQADLNHPVMEELLRLAVLKRVQQNG